MNLAGRSVLVTGGAGFIGSHVVEALLATDVVAVRVFDDLSSGSVENLAGVERDPRLRADIHGDVRDAAVLRRACEGIDCVVHLAAVKHNPSLSATQDLFDINTRGTFNVLEAAAACGVQKVVLASSLYAYGLHDRQPFDEERTLLSPRTLYGASKACAEMMLLAYGARYGFGVAALRYFFVYGPRLYRHHYQYALVPKTLARIAAGEPPEIYGDGQQTFDYVFIDDAVRATLLAMAAPQPALVLNVASGVPTSVLELVQSLIAEMGGGLTPRFGPADETAGTYRVGAASKARRELGFSAAVPLAEGVRRLVTWWRAATPQSG
jgi:UDP-glucose 4-epimerase